MESPWFVLIAAALIVVIPWAAAAWLRRWWLIRTEARVLKEKYGDLPMFRHLFR
ncbi:MAG TPA: hypothetical protein VFK80_02765 [Limnochordia bacterium]|nr:hypothetical protein [Limnochordia bacterium]